MLHHEWKKYKKILCVRTDNMGDVIMSSPAIKALKEDVAGRSITLLTSPSGEKAVKLLPYIDDYLVFDVPWMNKNASMKTVNEAILELKNRNFDAAVIFSVYSQNPLPAAMLCRQAGIEKVAAFCRENPYGLLSDWLPDPEPLFEIKHEVERQLDLVRSLGVNIKEEKFQIAISKQSEQKALEVLQEEGLKKERKYLVIHPGVSEKRRQYSVETIAQAAGIILGKLDIQIVLTGLGKEKVLTGFINEKLHGKAIDLAGKLNVEELAAVIRNAELLISNNTGPVHLAAAMERPVLVLYALTNPQHLPWKTPYIALPFDVPPEERSKNIIIQYVHQEVFRSIPEEITPQMISNSCFRLLCHLKEEEKSGILSL